MKQVYELSIRALLGTAGKWVHIDMAEPVEEGQRGTGGSFRRPVPRVLGGSQEGGCFLCAKYSGIYSCFL